MSFDGLILHLNVCLTIQRFFLLFVKKIYLIGIYLGIYETDLGMILLNCTCNSS